MQNWKKKPEVNLVIQEVVATDFFIVRLDCDMIAKSGHLKGLSGSWVSNAAFFDHQGGHLGPQLETLHFLDHHQGGQLGVSWATP